MNLKQEEMKTTHSIWGVLDGDGTMKGVKFNDSGNAILFEVSQDTDDGTYPRLCDYMRDINSLEREGVSHFINRLTRKRDKTQIEFYDGVKIIRENKWTDEAIIEFKEPVEVVLGYLGETPIVIDVTKIKGTFDHDYFWTRNGRQQKVANGYEIWFKIDKYLS